VKAGAEVLETNTFGANRLKLAQYGLEGQTIAINKRAAELAREFEVEERQALSDVTETLRTLRSLELVSQD